MKDYYCVVSFHSTYHALRFEDVFKNTDINIKLMPIPRQISSSCGTAAQFPCDRKEDILLICKQNDIQIDSVHKIEKESNTSFLKFFKLTKK
ncbi:Protein of unknown function [Alkalithermobacter thermoalcaliphilus JW-YL-7 = DSM 7308]|uniref:Putative Se/S carrier protein-like domain-containing protein n=1 Tax=Alkalithermobacter thermoalcaliphilus JW-YL-7 = DSM 7308 TaxID=1121328 RepID=A0A150FS38_CLOPD|nr:Protein of unknown function DUF3343 [[Clostridium] paradoxum JW-YL-7 = DSM 7308]SHK34361.1 Protein of unknown function [[Clostridium] paradoxum JW-YL-7 = DSM 7308]